MSKIYIKNKNVFYAGLVYFICIVLYIGARILWSSGVITLDPIISNLLFSVVVQICILFGLPFLLFSLLSKQSIKKTSQQFFFKKVSFLSVLYSIALGVLMYIVVVFLSTIWSSILTLFGYAPGTSSQITHLPVWAAFLLTIVSTSFLPGLCEETAHRGLIVGATKINGYKRAILLSGLMFGLAHLNIVQFGYAFVFGLVLATVTFISRSIWPAVIMHATNNFISVYLDYAGSQGWFLGNSQQIVSDFINNSVLAGILLTIFIICITITLIAILISQLFVQQKKQAFKLFKTNLYNSVKSTELEKAIDFDDNVQMYTLFNKASAQDLKNKVETRKMPIEHLEKELGRNSLNTMIYSEIDEYEKPRAIDNIFLYMAIALGVTVTIFTFIWGIL